VVCQFLLQRVRSDMHTFMSYLGPMSAGSGTILLAEEEQVLLQEVFESPSSGAAPSQDDVMHAAIEEEVSVTPSAKSSAVTTNPSSSSSPSLVETSSTTKSKAAPGDMRFAPMPPRNPIWGGDMCTPRRFRVTDTLLTRPSWNRWDVTVNPNPNPQRQQARVVYSQMLQTTYNKLEG